MKRKLLLVFSFLLVFPLAVRAAGEPNVTGLSTHTEDGGNIIIFSGNTENNSHAVMCKLYDNEEEIDKLSVEVTNEGSNGTFSGTFVTPSTGDYIVSCANYEGGTIVSDDVNVENMTQVAVEFNTNGGSAIDPVNVTVGQTISRPANPEKEGKVFAGWYEDETLTTPFDFSTRITAFITIYAKWNDSGEVQSQTRVQVIYSGGGTYQVDFETDDPDNQGPLHAQINHTSNYFVDPDTEVTLTANPSQGHHLAGWYATHEAEDPNNPGQHIWVEDELLSNQTEYTFTPNGEYVNIKLVFEEDTQEVYTVEFNTNGGSEIDPINVESGQKVSRPSNPHNGDKIFVQWCSDATLTTEFDFNTPITDNITIYAKWADPVITHTVEFNTNGGTSISPLEVQDGNVFEKPKNPTKDGKIFENWYEEEELEHEYNFNNPVTQGITLHAKWVQEYSKSDDNNNEVVFISDENKNLHLIVKDLSTLTDEELAILNPELDREAFNALFESLVEGAKKYGTLISLLDISILDQNNNTVDIETEVDVKLAFTEAMGDYKSYKLVYIDSDDDGNIVLGSAYNLTKQGTKLAGKLPHLSVYVLVGSNEEENTTDNINTNTTSNTITAGNPKTYDGIITYVVAFAIAIIGLAVLLIVNIKKRNKG